jgi:hypothetical protein
MSSLICLHRLLMDTSCGLAWGHIYECKQLPIQEEEEEPAAATETNNSKLAIAPTYGRSDRS